MKKKFLFVCFGGGKNQKKLLLLSIKRKIETIVIEYKKIDLKNKYIKKISASCYNLKSVQEKKEEIKKMIGSKHVEFLYRSSGPSILSLFYLSKVFKKKRISKELAYSIYSKSYFSKLLSKQNIPYIKHFTLKNFRLVKKLNKFVVKPDAPISGKKNVYLIEDYKKFNNNKFLKILNSSDNNRVICSDYVDGCSVAVFIFKTKKGKIIYYKPVYEKNNFRGGILEHIGIEECQDKIIVKNVNSLTKRILKNFPEYYGFLSVSYLIKNLEMIYPYEINIGLSGDNIAEKYLANKKLKQNPFEMEVDNLSQ